MSLNKESVTTVECLVCVVVIIRQLFVCLPSYFVEMIRNLFFNVNINFMIELEIVQKPTYH